MARQSDHHKKASKHMEKAAHHHAKAKEHMEKVHEAKEVKVIKKLSKMHKKK